MDQAAHRLEERAEHLATLVAEVAHHLQLLVDDHEELVDLLLVVEEVEELRPGVALGGESEGAADRVHPDVAAVDGDVPLGAGADEVAVAGEEDVGPVGAALALEQPAEHGQRRLDAPVGDPGPVVPADDEVGALALADLVADDRLDELAVLLVAGLEATRVGEPDAVVVDRLDHLGDGELRSVSTSTTTSGAPSSCTSNPRSATCRNGTASSRSAMWPCSGVPSSRGTSSSDSTTRRLRPTRPTVSRSPARVERRMIAHASCPRSASMASRAEVVAVMGEA